MDHIQDTYEHFIKYFEDDNADGDDNYICDGNDTDDANDDDNRSPSVSENNVIIFCLV